MFAICFCIPSYVHQQLISLDCQNFVHNNSLLFFYLSWELSWCRVSFLKGDLQFSEHNLYRCVHFKVQKVSSPFTPLHFLPYYVPHTEFKGSPEYASWNVLYHTSLRNYASFSLQDPSILSILLGSFFGWFVGLAVTVEEIFVLPFGCSTRPVQMFFFLAVYYCSIVPLCTTSWTGIRAGSPVS
jgi:hypothetical protein